MHSNWTQPPQVRVFQLKVFHNLHILVSLIASASPLHLSAFLTVSFDCFFPSLLLVACLPRRRHRWQLPCTSTNFQTGTCSTCLSPGGGGGRRGGVGRRSLCQIWVAHWVVDRKFDHHLRRRRQLSTFSILIMRSFCFVSSIVCFAFFSRSSKSVHFLCPWLYLRPPGEGCLLSAHLEIVSRDAYQNQFAFFETRIEHGREKGGGKGRPCEWEWENRKLNQCGSRAKWKSWSGCRNWIRFRIRIRVFNMRTLCQLLCES